MVFRTRCVVIWLCVAVVAAITVGSLYWFSYHRMVRRYVLGQATVVELHPEFHGTVRYEYQVQGRPFQGQTQPSAPNPPLEQLRLGQSLVLYYDRERPEKSVLGDPKLMLKNEPLSSMIATFCFLTLLAVAWAWRSSCYRAKESITRKGVQRGDASNERQTHLFAIRVALDAAHR